MKRLFKTYSSILFLFAGIITGALLGSFFPQTILPFKPIGDIFLNLLFTAVIPLIFFSVSSAIANLGTSRATGRLISITIAVFIGTVLLAATIAVLTLHFFPISFNFSRTQLSVLKEHALPGNQLARSLTVSDFPEILSRNSVLALIVFSMLTGAAARRAGGAGEGFRAFLGSGNAVMKKLLHLIMKLAPLGLGVYFACQVAATGAQLFKAYSHILTTGYCISILYYVLAFSAYAMFAGGFNAVTRYWKNNAPPSFTAFATCSSIAAIPANLEAAEKMGIPKDISEVLIPLGATLHKEGSAIVTIVGLSLVGGGLTSWEACFMALLVALLVSVIEGSIPNGGYTGQLLIMSVYHLPAEVWPIIIVISTLLDPVATLLNVTGDTASGLVIGRFMRNRVAS